MSSMLLRQAFAAGRGRYQALKLISLEIPSKQDELHSLLSCASNALEVNKSPLQSCTIKLPTSLGLEIPF